MQSYHLHFTDPRKGKALLKVLKSLDFVRISPENAEDDDPDVTPGKPDADLWKMFGLYPDIMQDEIRRKAWREIEI